MRTADRQTATADRSEAAPPAAARAWALMVFLMACLAFAFVDKQVVSILVGPLKADLGLSDVQIGLLQGFAFSCCHALVGVPLARLLDRGDRVRITSWCIAIWSGATMSCGLAGSFASLLASRALTAMGEAGLTPAAISLIRDRFAPRLMTRATAIFMTGPYIGMGLALLGGGPLLGWLAAHPVAGIAPWRLVFVAVGAPGLLLALAMRRFVREPRRAALLARDVSPPAVPLRDALAGRVGFVATTFLGSTVVCVPMYAQMAWMPTYLIRVQQFTAATAGATIGPIYIAAGIGGTVAAATLTAGARNPLRRIILLIAMAAAVLAVSATATSLVAAPAATLALFAVSIAASSTIIALLPTPLQLIAPPSAVARLMVVLNITLALGAAGVGPLAVGVVTDRVFADPLMVGVSLAIVCGVSSVLGAIVFGVASIGVRRLDGRRPAPLAAAAL